MKTTTNQRAYSVLEIKAVDDEKRIIEGIASTPTPDRMGDVVEPMGMDFKTPFPLLYQHDRDKPIGNVVSAKVTKTGMSIRAQLAPAGVAPFIDEAISLIKHGLVRGLSIGFRPTEEPEWDKNLGGYRFNKTEILELSAVTIPANAEANITTIKSLDEQARASHGNPRRSPIGLEKTANPAAAVAQTKAKSMTIKEQIAGFEAKRAALSARRDEIENKLAEEVRSADQAEREELNSLDADLDGVDEHLDRLRKREARLVATATAVTPQNTATVKTAADTRSGIVTVQSRAPKGVGIARAAICQFQARKQMIPPAVLARQHYPDMPELEVYLKAAVDAGDTTTSGWAEQLVPDAATLPNEFLEMLRPATVLGRIPGINVVPFNVRVPVQTGGGTFGWVGEAAGKPVTSFTFDEVTLRWAKVAGIVVITEELARFASPSAEMIIRDQMIAGATRFIDAQFVGSAAAVANVSPAGILNTISAVAASGTTAAAFRTDFNNALNNFTANNQELSGIVVLMSSTNAVALSLMVTDLGVPLFPNINSMGGSILGFPVVVSEALSTNIVFVKANQIFKAEGGIRVDISREASVEMETTPAVGEQSPITALSNIKSLWQNNLVGFRVENYITWVRGRTSAVEYISGTAYVPS